MIILRSDNDSPRFRYVLDYIFNQRLGCAYRINGGIGPDDFVIGYGQQTQCHYNIPDSRYLWMNDIPLSLPPFETSHDTLILFPVNNENGQPFDVFAAIFFMLSRAEEYLPFEADQHERFDVQHSLTGKLQLHQRAWVDEWIILLRNELKQKGCKDSFRIEQPSVAITVDVDQIFSFRNKGLKRTLGGLLRDLFQGKAKSVIHRLSTIIGLKKDPFDTFYIFEKWNKMHHVALKFFILSAIEKSKFDKNGKIHKRASLQKILAMNNMGSLALHPSYDCLYRTNRLSEEKMHLERLCGISINDARRHYLRMRIPQSYQQLIETGFSADYTMGFASDVGFRAGTSHPFYFFDLSKNESTELTVYPFIMMDGSLNDYKKTSIDTAADVLKTICQYTHSIGGCFTLLMHNETLSEQGRWRGWKDMLEQWIEESHKQLS